MTAQTAVLRGRRAAEALMVDVCTVTRAGSSTTDDLTGAVTSTPSTVYSGKCKIQQQSAVARRYDAGEITAALLRLEVHLPVTAAAAGAQRGDLITITAATLDASLIGKVFRVREEAGKTFGTAYRLGVEEVT